MALTVEAARRAGFVLLAAGFLAGCQPIAPAGQGNATGGETGQDTTTAIPIEAEVETAIATPVETAVSEDARLSEDDALAGDAGQGVLRAAGDGERLAETLVEPGDGGSDAQGLIALGMDVYRENYCGVCHRLAAVGTSGAFGPPHDEMGRVAGERIVSPAYRGTATDAAGYIWESIVDPYVYLVPTYEVTQHRMPPYAHLDDERIEALVAMLLAQE